MRPARLVAVLALAVLGATGGAVEAGSRPADGAVGPIVAEDFPATANDYQRPVASNSPVIAVDPTDARFVALAHRVDAPEFGCGLQVSGDGGRGFVPARPVPHLPEGADRCYAPEVAFGPDGTFYYLFVGLAGGGNVPMGVFLTTSTDRARRFSAPRRVLGPHSFAVRMAVDPGVGQQGRIHLVWLAASAEPPLGSMPSPPNPLLAAHSDDGGRTFSTPVQVSDRSRQRVVAPALALGADHSVHVLYYDLGDDARDYQGLEGPTWEGTWSLVLATSPDRGRRFGRGTVVDDGVVPPERVMLIFTMPPPALAIDGQGRLFAAWHDARNGDWDVFMRRSSEGGWRWSEPLRLNDDPVGNGRHQYQPRLAVAPGGRVDAVFYDRRDDPDNVRNHVVHTFSTDAGQRFSPNRTLASRASDSRIGQRYAGPAAEGLVEFGSRLGLVSDDRRAIAAWTDTRNAQRPAQQDVFATVVAFPPPAPSAATEPAGRASRSWLAVAAGAIAAPSLVVLSLRRRRARNRSAKVPEP
ncbi:MAG: sialidase family protein [Acidimicrobiales bacterium]